VRSLLGRANTIVSDEQDQETERQHVKSVLRDNGYEEWILDLPPKQPNAEPTDTTTPKMDRPRAFPIPYIHGMAENIAKIFRKYGVPTYLPTYHKPYNTLRSQVVRPKDPTPNNKKCRVVYELKCEDCDSKYVGKTSRSFETRLKEHKRGRGVLTAVGEHLKNTGHKLDDQGTTVVAREPQFWPRKIHEAIEIKLRTPDLNRDTGYHLPPIYDTLLSGDLGTRPPDR
jgi:hypothetical protein